MSHRHATDVVSLVFGIILAGCTAAWLLTVTDTVDGHDLWWAGPAVLVVAGAAGLIAALVPDRRRSRAAAAAGQAGPAGPAGQPAGVAAPFTADELDADRSISVGGPDETGDEAARSGG